MLRALLILLTASYAWSAPTGAAVAQLTSSTTMIPNSVGGCIVWVPVVNDNDFKLIANGGRVANSNGWDIRYWSDLAHTVELPHDLITYSGTTGTAKSWVKTTCLVSAFIYITYGDSSIVATTSSATTYSSYISSWGLGDGTTLNANDATGTNNGTLVGPPTPIAGVYNGAGHFISSSSQYISGSLISAATLPLSASVVFRLNSIGNFVSFISIDANDNTGVRMGLSNANQFVYIHGGVATFTFTSLPTVTTGTTYYFGVSVSGNGGTVTGYAAAVGGTLVSQTIAIGTPGGAMNKFHLSARGGNVDFCDCTFMDEARYVGSAKNSDWFTVEFSQTSASFITVGAGGSIATLGGRRRIFRQ